MDQHFPIPENAAIPLIYRPTVRVLLAYSVALLPIGFIAWMGWTLTPCTASICLLSLIASYALYIALSYKSAYMKSDGALAIVAMYAALTFGYVVFFALAYATFAMINPIVALDNDTTRHTSMVFGELFIRMFYFSTATFTTLGYGDMVPLNNYGRIFASVQAILGTTHMVSFLALFLSKFSANPK